MSLPSHSIVFALVIGILIASSACAVNEQSENPNMRCYCQDSPEKGPLAMKCFIDVYMNRERLSDIPKSCTIECNANGLLLHEPWMQKNDMQQLEMHSCRESVPF